MKWFLVRLFCDTVDCYASSLHSMKLGDVWKDFESQPIQYVKCGENKLWIRKKRKI